MGNGLGVRIGGTVSGNAKHTQQAVETTHEAKYFGKPSCYILQQVLLRIALQPRVDSKNSSIRSK